MPSSKGNNHPSHQRKNLNSQVLCLSVALKSGLSPIRRHLVMSDNNFDCHDLGKEKVTREHKIMPTQCLTMKPR